MFNKQRSLSDNTLAVLIGSGGAVALFAIISLLAWVFN